MVHEGQKTKSRHEARFMGEMRNIFKSIFNLDDQFYTIFFGSSLGEKKALKLKKVIENAFVTELDSSLGEMIAESHTDVAWVKYEALLEKYKDDTSKKWRPTGNEIDDLRPYRIMEKKALLAHLERQIQLSQASVDLTAELGEKERTICQRLTEELKVAEPFVAKYKQVVVQEKEILAQLKA